MQKKVMALCLRVQFFLANPIYNLCHTIHFSQFHLELYCDEGIFFEMFGSLNYTRTTSNIIKCTSKSDIIKSYDRSIKIIKY